MSTVTRKVTTALATIIVAIATLVAPTTASAITGGTDAKVGTIADSTARVQIGNKSCTGTLIAPTWIITAKHCIGRGDYSFVSVGAPEHGETARVKDYIAHPDSDLLLVHTTKTMQSPVAPLATSYTTEGQAGYSMGWGSYREQNKTTIQQAEVEVQRQVT
ncbi:trypsin-like serine protease, partial [Corynebacterium pyruviciproducens]